MSLNSRTAQDSVHNHKSQNPNVNNLRSLSNNIDLYSNSVPRHIYLYIRPSRCRRFDIIQRRRCGLYTYRTPDYTDNSRKNLSKSRCNIFLSPRILLQYILPSQDYMSYNLCKRHPYTNRMLHRYNIRRDLLSTLPHHTLSDIHHSNFPLH